jgi:hypothetical protein
MLSGRSRSIRKESTMTDPHDRPSADPSPSSGVPRWVKIFALIAVVLIVLFVLVQVATGGKHGPGRHLSMATPQTIRLA